MIECDRIMILIMVDYKILQRCDLQDRLIGSI